MKLNATLRHASRLALMSSALLMGQAHAQAIPDATECIAPAKPGGGYDLTCRLAANGLQETALISRPMMVSYMPGGIGAVAYNHVNGVRTDDPGLIVAASTGAAVNLALGKFGEYDADGFKLGQTGDSAALLAGEKWKFKAIIFEDNTVTAKVLSLDAY